LNCSFRPKMGSRGAISTAANMEAGGWADIRFPE
jgi:hypothetical protein